MKTIKQKGFTLVELLVVIAILAILATVSVVGYTSFIESANVAVDNDLVAQLNHFLAAYKVENHGLVINEHNVREVTRDILKESGLETLVPKSKNNHFYYDLEAGEYALVENDVATGGNSGVIFNWMAHAEGETYDKVPGNCFTDGRKYYFVDTEGKIADVINSFYTHTGEKEFDDETFSAFVTSAGKISSEFTSLLNESVFITNGGVYFVDGSTKENKYFHDNDGLVIDKPLDIKLEVVNNVVTPFEIPANVSQIDTGSLNFTNLPENYEDVVFTVDMDAEAFADVILYDENLTVKFEMSGNVVGTLGTDSTTGAYVIKADTNYPLDILKNKVIHVTSDHITHLGNANQVNLSDLFKLRNGLTSLPGDGWKLVVYSGSGSKLVETANAGKDDLSVNDADQNVTVTNGSLTELTLQFKNADVNNKIKIAIENADGEYAAVEVYVVNGKNVRSWAELAGSDTTAVASTSTSIVMLDNIAMPEIIANVGYCSSWNVTGKNDTSANLPTAKFTISGGATLYGNHFTFDVTNGLVTGPEGIITVTGHLRDVRIIGRIFPEFGSKVSQKWGTNVVKANSGSTITNCYIANGRAPIRTSGTVTIKDSVLFGGRYANICITSGTLTLEGTVICVNQPHNNPYDDVDSSVVGVGISVWYDSTATIKLATDAKFLQYNFIPETEAKNMPTVAITGIGIGDINLGDAFKNLFKSGYEDFIFEDENGTRYVNAANANMNGAAVDISTMDGYEGAQTNISGKTICVYAPVNNNSDANNKFFADSFGATDKYSSWYVNDSNPAYDFELIDGEWTIIH